MAKQPTDPAQAWHAFVLTVAHELRIDRLVDWLAPRLDRTIGRHRWLAWLDTHLPSPPSPWRTLVWFGCAYTAVVGVAFVWAWFTGQLT